MSRPSVHTYTVVVPDHAHPAWLKMLQTLQSEGVMSKGRPDVMIVGEAKK